MNTLEEYLIKEEILEKFLGNVDLDLKLNAVSLNTAFSWIDSPEGDTFWIGHYVNNVGYIKVSRIEELLQERIPRFRKE